MENRTILKGFLLRPADLVDLSSKVEYGLLALMALARSYDRNEPLQICQIASQQEIPDRYLEQLLATLRRGGLVRSQRGARGGYYLARPPWQITLLDVKTCLEGPAQAEGEGVSRSAERAIVQEIWQEVQQTMKAVWQGYTLQDLCQRWEARQNRHIMYYI